MDRVDISFIGLEVAAFLKVLSNKPTFLWGRQGLIIR
jgi:hypothetical protein